MRLAPFFLVLGLALAPTLAAEREAQEASAAGWLGVSLGQAPPGEDGAAGGVAVRSVMEDSPAVRAGLRAHDRIVSVDGAPVGSPSDLVARVRGMSPGSWIPLQVVRRGDELDLRVRLEPRPADLRGLRPIRAWIGLLSIDLPPTLRKHFGAPEESGVMVSAIETGSPAEAAGFELGDVIYEMDGQPVLGAGDLKGRMLGAGVGNPSEFTLLRDGVEMVVETVFEKLPETPQP